MLKCSTVLILTYFTSQEMAYPNQETGWILTKKWRILTYFTNHEPAFTLPPLTLPPLTVPHPMLPHLMLPTLILPPWHPPLTLPLVHLNLLSSLPPPVPVPLRLRPLPPPVPHSRSWFHHWPGNRRRRTNSPFRPNTPDSRGWYLGGRNILWALFEQSCFAQ